MIAALYFLASFGFAYIVGFAKISAGVRYLLSPPMIGNGDELPVPAPGVMNELRYWLVSLLECPACVGWWLGVFFGPTFLAVPIQDRIGLSVFCGCATAASSFILGRASRLI